MCYVFASVEFQFLLTLEVMQSSKISHFLLLDLEIANVLIQLDNHRMMQFYKDLCGFDVEKSVRAQSKLIRQPKLVISFSNNCSDVSKGFS